MKKVLYVLFLFILPLAFSSCRDEETPTPIEEVKLEYIKCVDYDKNEIDKINYVIGQTEYAYSNVYVYAYYSNGNISDVTTLAEFDNIDFTTVGEKKVNVKYREMTDDFTIVITEITIERIEIDCSEVKTEYVINEELNIEGLKVYKVMSDSFFGEVKDYKYTLLDSNSNEVRDYKFKKAGNYLVQIEYLNKYEYFNVYVYESVFDYSFTVDSSKYESQLEDGYYTFNGIEDIYKENDFVFQSTSGVKLKLKENNADIYYNYNGNIFDYNIEINYENSLVFDSSKDYKMLIIVDGTSNYDCLNITNHEGNSIFYSSSTSNGNTLIFIEEGAGIYNISCSIPCTIKGILLNIFEGYKYEEIIVDYENVKTTFVTGDPFTYDNLVVYGKVSESLVNQIPLEECAVKIEQNGQIVYDLNVNGVYDVVVSYNGQGILLTTSYTIIVQNIVIPYDKISLELSDVKTVYEEGESIDFSGLVVYGINKLGMEIINTNLCTMKLFFKDSLEEFEVSNFISSPGEYYVLVTYKNRYVELTEKYEVMYKIGLLEYDNKVEPIIEYISDNSVMIYIENVLETLIDVKLLVYYDGELIHNVNSLSVTINNLNPNRVYLVRGYYKGKIGNQEYIVYLENTLIDFNSYN